MALFNLQRNVMSGQCKQCLMRIQIRYTALFVGVGWLPEGWSGLQWGFFTPVKIKDKYRCLGFYGGLLPGLPGAVCRWPKWYYKVWKFLYFRLPGTC